jgi:Transglutaminase-like superfamily/TgpA N-terminal domain
MQDTAIEGLSKIIADPHPGGDDSGKNRQVPSRPGFHWHLGLAEGWFSLFLLAAVVFSTIWCVEAAGWVAHLNILSLTTLVGLIGGVVAAKQRRLSRLVVHPVALVVGLLLALWQTAGADYGGNVSALLHSMHQWLMIALAGGSSSDDSIFLFFITALGFLLAYTSAWLVYRTRKPWLMILANAVVLLINLSNIDSGYIVFLVVFLVAAMLLMLRFHLYESSVRWKRQGLRSADDLGWEFMQVGALICIGILIFAWILPSGYKNDAAAQIWSADNNPWVQLQNAWNRLISVSGGVNLSNRGNFTDTLVLGGNPNLNNDIVFTVRINGDGQYLESLSYDTYNGRGWTSGPTVGTTVKANTISYDGSQDLNAIRQDITVVNPPGEQYPYLLGASQIASANQAAEVLASRATGSAIAWLRTNGKLTAGSTYTVVSYISGADVKTLRTVPLPVNAPTFIPDPARPDLEPPVTYFDPNILKTYSQLPSNLDPNIKNLAEQVTAGAHTMYDKAVALESYFHDNYTYDVHISLPPGEEGVSWLLFRSQHRAFCNYFATAMAIMARELGIPARVVSGYTSGKFDSKQNEWVIRGSDAHSWVQIYFAGYGWVNFEPSPRFQSFTRPIASSQGSPGIIPNGPGGSQRDKNNNHLKLPELPSSVNTNTAVTAAQQQAQLRQDVGLALAGLILLILSGAIFFGIWWRRLYHGYGLPAQIYGRVCTLAKWAGLSIRPSQTPFEYMHTLEEATPDEAVTLERLGDIYVRDRWADPSSTVHPRRTGEIAQLPGMWKQLQPRLFLYVLRHPYFLRRLPERIGSLIGKRKSRQRVPRLPDDVVTIED